MEGSSLYIKEIELDELDERVMAWFYDTQLMQYYTNSRQIITKESLMASITQGAVNKNNYTYGIYDKSNDLLIGTLKLGPINYIHKISDLVILIGDRNYLGKGLSSQAIELGNRIAFDYFDIRKLYGGMYASNIPSIKAYLKAGWLAEGILKGFYFEKGQNEDRLLVGCFNPKYFSDADLSEIKTKQTEFLDSLKSAK